ncbi:unnamed protein product [Cuscuta epithymum]|uniref:Uncharacterized protein n=1 Tax=Cuscuta epithymum TaxID=186058 RepID=A0AAV0G4P8_9ASTE|nr:unnamed protein product [Cuscuta epithymum]
MLRCLRRKRCTCDSEKKKTLPRALGKDHFEVANDLKNRKKIVFVLRARLVAQKSANLAEVATLADSAHLRKIKIYFINKIKKKLYVKIVKMVVYSNFSQNSQKK